MVFVLMSSQSEDMSGNKCFPPLLSLAFSVRMEPIGVEEEEGRDIFSLVMNGRQLGWEGEQSSALVDRVNEAGAIFTPVHPFTLPP